MINSGIWGVWGKARPLDDAHAAYHPLLYHSLDVAAVGGALLNRWPSWLERLAFELGTPPDELRRLILLLLALHDIGKISRPFQAKAPEHWPVDLLGPMDLAPAGPRHDACGLGLLGDQIATVLDPVLPGWRRSLRLALLAPFMGHHGRPVALPQGAATAIFGEKCCRAAQDFVKAMIALFEPRPFQALAKDTLLRASWRLAGLAVLADWIGSSQVWFHYEPPTHDVDHYWREIARPRARAALIAAGLGRLPRLSSATSFRAVTGLAASPSPVQRWAEEVSFPQGPVLALIEEVTGGGKTESALVLAARLMQEGRAKGLFIALPTMATANAMFDRIKEGCSRLFAKGERPSLVLAHSRRALEPNFNSLTIPFGAQATSGEEDERDVASAVAPAWLADDRKKTFLADLGVGTVDQALLAVLTVRHQSLRLLGLADRVLIVDEAHAYDSYMKEELKRLLEFQAALGGNAIVLSATLSQRVRQELAVAFAKGLAAPAPVLRGMDYPLVTLISSQGADEQAKAHRPDLGRELMVERLASVADVLARIAEGVRAGAAIAWVRNTVDDAIEAVERLRADGLEADLFHARFAMGDRLEIEERVVCRFGRKGDPAKRPGVLVATQVVEQSLDLDFDLMVSDLAPIDLLLQRAGRLWRHTDRERPVAGPKLLVLSPDPNGPVTRDWLTALLPRAGWVYRNHALLWLSARELFAREKVRVPEDVRGLIEAVYGEGAETSAPTTLERYWMESRGNDQAARAVAHMNLLRVDSGYGGEEQGEWPDDTIVPTRLGEPTVTLRLARFDGRKVVPYSEDADLTRAWALSEVMVRAARVRGAGSFEPWLAVLSGQSQDTEAGAVALLGVGPALEDERDQSGGA